MPFGVAAAVAAPVVGGLVQGAMSGSGASASRGISREVMQKGAENYAHDQGNYQPFISTGQNALASMADFSNLNGQDASTAALGRFQASPGYQWTKDQAMQGIDHGAAANGMLRSGETLRAEATLGANLASNEFGNYMNRLSGIAGMGLQGAGLGNQSTSTYDGLLTGTGGQQASNAQAAGNTQASIYGNAINGAVGGYNNYQSNRLFSAAIGGGGGGGGSAFDGAGVSAGGFGF